PLRTASLPALPRLGARGCRPRLMARLSYLGSRRRSSNRASALDDGFAVGAHRQAHRGCLTTGIDSAPSDEEASGANATRNLWPCRACSALRRGRVADATRVTNTARGSPAAAATLPSGDCLDPDSPCSSRD